MTERKYPREWQLPGGRMATLRPISVGDFEIESVFLESLSPESSYGRLHSARRPSSDEIRRWTDIDLSREFAFVITTHDQPGREAMLAVGRAVVDRDTPHRAEFALLVGDGSQRLGLGTRLLEALIDESNRRGLATLFGSAMSTNSAMLELAKRRGFATRREIGDATTTLMSLSLTPKPGAI